MFGCFTKFEFISWNDCLDIADESKNTKPKGKIAGKVEYLLKAHYTKIGGLKLERISGEVVSPRIVTTL